MLEQLNVNYTSYLNTEIPKLINNHQNNKYWYSYNLTRIKRLLTHTIIIFIFQYMITASLSYSPIALPMYPPIGIAFVMFYLLGKNALLGLLFGGFCAYFLKNMPIETTILYLMADVGCSYVGAILCQSVFSSDIKPFANLTEVFKFFRINALITCSISALLRICAVILVNHKITFYEGIGLWLADLNAVLILYSFVLSWLYVFFSREKIVDRNITVTPTIILMLAIVFSVLFIQKIAVIYLIVVALMISIYYAYVYGYLIATMLLFICSSIFLSYFIGHGAQYVASFGVKWYSLVQVVLLLFTAVILYVGHFRLGAPREQLNYI